MKGKVGAGRRVTALGSLSIGPTAVSLWPAARHHVVAFALSQQVSSTGLCVDAN